MMPLIAFYGQSIADRFPTHAEQFNQNINSQAMNSANLTRDSLDAFSHFIAVMLFCGVQAIELRSKLAADSYDAREVLSPATRALYEAVRSAACSAPDAARSVHWNDLDEFIQPKIEGVLTALQPGGPIIQSMAKVSAHLRSHRPY